MLPITLVSTLYEENFKQHLKDNSWFREFQSKYITKKRLIINNLYSTKELEDILNELYDSSEVELVYVDEHADRVIEKYKLNIDRNHHAYNFCVPYFVNIDTCETPYFFNVSTDCCIDIHIDDDYFAKSIDLLENHPEYSVKGLATRVSHCKYSEDKIYEHPTNEVGEWEQLNCLGFDDKKILEHFWISNVFNDQVFLGKTNNFKKLKDLTEFGKKYKEISKESYAEWMSVRSKYSARAGLDAFECKVSDYLRFNDIFNTIYKSKTTYYIHSGHIDGSNIK
jgi:hypothetical protein